MVNKGIANAQQHMRNGRALRSFRSIMKRVSHVAGWIALSMLPGIGLADRTKIAPDLKPDNEKELVDVIVQFAAAPDESKHQKIFERGGQLKLTHELINGATYSIPGTALEALASDPDVVYISPDRQVRASAFNGTADYGWMTVTSIDSPSG